MANDSITVTRTVPASPFQIFALLTLPEKHAEIDGSGMIRGIEGEPGALEKVGDSFVMNMHNDDLGDYQMKNTITAFETGTVIGWGPALHPADGYTDKIGDMKVGGHTYTWYLEPDGDGTKVTQTYDWSGVDDEGFAKMLPMLDEQMLADSIERVGTVAG